MRTYKDPIFIKKVVNSVNDPSAGLILFLGAGFSKLCGLPLWRELAKDMLDFCVSQKETHFDFSDESLLLSSVNDPRELLSIAQKMMIDAKKEKEFYFEMSRLLTVDRAKEPSRTRTQREKLIDFVKKTRATVITTNSDCVLDEEFRHNCYSLREISDFTLGDEPKILHIHGSIKDYGSLVFTTDKYLERYSDSGFKKSIHNVFEGRPGSTVLFIGYGFSELQLLDFLISGETKTEQGIAQNRYAIEGFFSYEDCVFSAEDSYYRIYGINLVSYSKDKYGFSGLVKALQYIAGQIEKTADVRSKGYLESTLLIAKKPTMADFDALSRNASTMPRSLKKGLLEAASKSSYSNEWIPYMMSDRYLRSLFSVANLKSVKKADRKFQRDADFSGVSAVAEAFKKTKSEKLLAISRRMLKRIFVVFERDAALFENAFFVGMVERWIFSDPRLAENCSSFQFVSKATEKQPLARQDWVLWASYETDSLLTIPKNMALAYFHLAVMSCSSCHDTYYFETFLDKYSAFITRYPREIFDICFELMAKRLHEDPVGTDCSRNPFFFFEKGSLEEPIRFEDLLVEVLVRAAKWLTFQETMTLYKELKDKPQPFYRNLCIYLCNVHFSEIRKLFFEQDGAFLNERKLYSEFYFLLQAHSGDMSSSEISSLIAWVSQMRIEGTSDFFNSACQIRLLSLIIPREMALRQEQATALRDSILSNLPADDKDSIDSFIDPKNVSKDIYVESLPPELPKSGFEEKDLLLLDNPSFFKKTSDCEKESPEMASILSVSPLFFEEKNTIRWIMANDYRNFDLVPTACYESLSAFVFGEKCDIQLAEALDLMEKCTKKLTDEAKSRFLNHLCERLYFSERSKFSSFSKEANRILVLGIERINDPGLSWTAADYYASQRVTSTMLFSIDAFFSVGLVTRTIKPENKEKILALFSQLIASKDKAPVAKAAIAANIGYLWKADEEWVRNVIVSIFDDMVSGINYAYFGFSISPFHSPDFVAFLFEKGILSKLLNSSEFLHNDNYYGYYIFRNFLDGKVNENVVKMVLGSQSGVGSLHILNNFLIKDATDFLSKNEKTINSFFSVVMKSPLGGSSHYGHLVFQILTLLSMVSEKTILLSLVKRLCDNWESVSAESIGAALTKSGLDNREKIEILQRLIHGVKDEFSFADEIVNLFRLVDWSNDKDTENDLKNYLAELNPSFYEIFQKNGL